MKTDLKRIEKLIQLARKYRLSEFSIDEGKIKVSFKFKEKNSQYPFNSGLNNSSGESSHSLVTEKSSTVAEVEDSNTHKVLSPFVGTFYGAPSPEAESYIKEGQMVRKGDVLCIVEAMKLMNEIECEVSGKILKCLVENGQTVEYGEPLFLVEL